MVSPEMTGLRQTRVEAGTGASVVSILSLRLSL